MGALDDIARGEEADELRHIIRTIFPFATDVQVYRFAKGFANCSEEMIVRAIFREIPPQAERGVSLIQFMLRAGVDVADPEGGQTILGAMYLLPMQNGRITEAAIRDAVARVTSDPNEQAGAMASLDRFVRSGDNALLLASLGKLVTKFGLPLLEDIGLIVLPESALGLAAIDALAVGGLGLTGFFTDPDNAAPPTPTPPRLPPSQGGGAGPALPPGGR